MKVLAINGDRIESGVTKRALEECCEALNRNGIETEIFWLGEDEIQECRGCGKCIKRKKCFFDSVVNTVNERCVEFDGILIGCPVYFGEASDQVLHFLNRLFQSGENLWNHKPAATIISSRRNGGIEALGTLNRYFLENHMPVVPSQYAPQLSETEDAEALQTLRMLGENMAWLLKCIEIGKREGMEAPQLEESLRPHFIR